MQPPRTIPELFLQAVERHDSPAFMRYKAGGEFASIPAREFRKEVELAAFGLIELGVQQGDRVALLSENRPGWAFADLATLSVGAWSVPIYTSLMPDEIEYILNDCSAVACFVSTAEQLAKIDAMRARCPALKHVITLEPIESSSPSTMTARSLLEQGQAFRAKSPGVVEQRLAAIEPEHTASILYTSGTTGQPKGVMLSHNNFVTNVIDGLKSLVILTTDTNLSFLPLSHSFERTAGYYIMMHAGSSIAYAESVDAVIDNMAEVQPTVMTSVPRLYEKLYAGVLQKATDAGGLKKQLVFWARRIGIDYAEKRVAGERIPTHLAIQYRIADRLVFSKIRQLVGGRIRFFVSGGAPLAPVIAKFFYAAGMPILEGYGLTETSPVISVNTFGAIRFGTVGKAIENVEVKIEPDPDQPGGEGEILVRGPNVMQGYYNLPEKTAEVLSPDGWFRTGDIGFIDNDGFIAITDRKRDLIKTSGGKFIAPQPIENDLKTSRYVSQAVVVGNRRKYASVLIVPNMDNVERYCREHNVATDDTDTMLESNEVQALFEELLEKINHDKSSYETLKKFCLVPRDFTIEAGELTPTLKVKRRVIEEKYSHLIDTMYEPEVALAE